VPPDLRSRSGTWVLAGGGTGGHVYPAIAVAREIRRRRPADPLLFVGTRRGLEAELAPREGFEIAFISASGFVGKGIAAKARSLASVVAGTVQAVGLLRRRRARAVFGVGGYVSLPVLVAARLSGIPSMIHEQNSVPGVANRIAHRLSRITATGFESAARRFPRGAVWTGNPVRAEFFAVAPFSPARPARRLLLFGGSQGAHVLNQAILAAADELRAAGVHLTAQTGPGEHAAVARALADWPDARIEPFLPRMWEEMERADLVICRAGALTIAELAAAGRPSILVPLAAATHGHQDENAVDLAGCGGAVVLPERELDGPTLARRCLALLLDPDGLARMGEAARSRARPRAAEELVDLLFSLDRSAA